MMKPKSFHNFNYFYFALFWITLIAIQPVFSQEQKKKTGLFSRPSQFDHRVNGDYFKWYLYDTKELIIAPGR